jgi:uncharacterized protein YaeQ
MMRRDGARARCFTRNDHDWAGPLPGCYRGLSAARLKVRSVLAILMCAHRKSHSLGIRFADNKPDVARRATSDDDAVLISGEPEARNIDGRDRIAGDFVISHHHDWSRRVYWNSTTKAPVRMAKMAVHISESQMSAVVRVTQCSERP